MRYMLILTSVLLMFGCAAEQIVEEKTVMVEPAVQPVLDVTVVPADQEGKIIKLRGKAYLRDEESGEGFMLLPGDTIPLGKIFYLDPKTTMTIKQDTGNEIYLYSKEKEAFYRLEKNQ
jgi:hypothetical protein